MKQSMVLVLCVMGLFGCAKDGKTGAAGPKGDSVVGAPGSNGLGCSVSSVPVSGDVPNGGSLITCGDGSSSLVLNGSNGSDGHDAVAPQLADPVKLCPGVNSYPAVFIEIAFCINNKLFAVYSLNNGFMTELTPGAYSSNAVGSSCNFIVNNNCSVSH